MRYEHLCRVAAFRDLRVFRAFFFFFGWAFYPCWRFPARLRLLSLHFQLQCRHPESNSVASILCQGCICRVTIFFFVFVFQKEPLLTWKVWLGERAERPVWPSRILRCSPALARWEFCDSHRSSSRTFNPCRKRKQSRHRQKGALLQSACTSLRLFAVTRSVFCVGLAGACFP